MVHLMLDRAGEQSLAGDLDSFAVQRCASDCGLRSPRNRCGDTRNAEAAFDRLFEISGGFDEFRIDENVEFAIDIEDDDSFRGTNLRSRQAYAVGPNHRLNHLLAEGANLRCDFVYSGCALTKDRVSQRLYIHGSPLFVPRRHYKVEHAMLQGNSTSQPALQKILELEESTGYADRAVTCGLEAYVRRAVPDAASLVAGYCKLVAAEREKVVAALRKHLAGPRDVAARDPVDVRSPIRFVKGVGEKRASALQRLGIATVEDLLHYLPRALEDRSRFVAVRAAKSGDSVSIRGEVMAVSERRIRRGMSVVKVAVGDGTGFLYAVWFNQPWLAKQIKRGDRIDLYGTVEYSRGELQIRSPVWEPEGEGVEVGRIVPIYPATEGITDRYLRTLIHRQIEALQGDLPDIVPGEVRCDAGMLPSTEAIVAMHRPETPEAFDRARRSLAFEELFLLYLGLLDTVSATPGVCHIAQESKIASTFLAGLPFSLTQSQREALAEIESDMGQPVQMRRLLQGDVGSGKTIVAIVAALRAIDAGFQVAFMAPTELLAEQHAIGLERLLEGLPVRTVLLTGTTKDKASIRDDMTSGIVDLVIGTHALIQDTVAFQSLGLVIIDEQHRFGVAQRSSVEEKGESVDLLIMSATPIPRTIAMTLYGEFDVSTLDEFPLGARQRTTTWVSERQRKAVLRDVEEMLGAGRKGFFVLPLVEESENVDAKAAVQAFEELQGRYPNVGIALAHGRMPAKERSAAMGRFRSGEAQLLVATTVIEVGIDVLDADFMVIEHADRFGLAQLHQLRGRIGRAGQPAVCIAVADAGTEEAERRLTAFSAHDDGFSIAEEDLRIRGPGDLLGTQQHGFLTQLRAVDLIRDVDLMAEARAAALRVQVNGFTQELREEVKRRFSDLLKWLNV